MWRQKSKPGSLKVSIRQELFDQLLDSLNRLLGVDSNSFEQRKYDQWKRSGPTWQKEIVSQRLILRHRLGDQIGQVECGTSISEPLHKFFEPLFLSQICHEVWVHFEKLPPEETKNVRRDEVIGEFQKVVSTSMDMPETIRSAYLKALKEPFSSRENKFREVVNLSPLKEENSHGEIRVTIEGS